MKNRKESQEFDLPPGFEWEQMKSGIYEKMNAQEETVSPNLYRPFQVSRKLGVAAVLLLMALVVAVAPLFVNGLSKADLLSKKQDSPNNPVATGRASDTSSAPLSFAETQSTQFASVSGPLPIDSIDAGAIRAIRTEVSSVLTTVRTNQPYSPPAQDSLALVDIRQTIETLTIADNFQKESDSLMFDPIVDHNQVEAGTDLPDFVKLDQAISQDSSVIGGAKNARVSRIQVKAGSMIWNDFTSMTERKETESALLSFGFNANLLKPLGAKSFWLAGLAYSQYQSKCEFDRLITGHTISVPNKTIRVEHNSLTGEYTSIMGSVTDTVDAIHHFRNYNSSTILKLTVGSGHFWASSSHRWAIYYGASFGFWSSHRGRVLYLDDVLDLNESLFSRRSQWDGFLDVQYWKPLNSSLEFTSGFKVQKYLSNWSSVPGTRYSPGSVSLQLGLNYALP
jgi:hypothetical protein